MWSFGVEVIIFILIISDENPKEVLNQSQRRHFEQLVFILDLIEEDSPENLVFFIERINKHLNLRFFLVKDKDRQIRLIALFRCTVLSTAPVIISVPHRQLPLVDL